jgi:hypothetical protein
MGADADACTAATGMPTTGAPHDMQNASSAASAAPQDAHDGPTGAFVTPDSGVATASGRPHVMQNASPTSSGAPHEGHAAEAPSPAAVMFSSSVVAHRLYNTGVRRRGPGLGRAREQASV